MTTHRDSSEMTLGSDLDSDPGRRTPDPKVVSGAAAMDVDAYEFPANLGKTSFLGRKPTQRHRARWHGDRLLSELKADPKVSTVDVESARLLLEAARKRAEGWRNGVAATLALIFATLAIKGPGDGIGKIDGVGRHVVAGVVIASLILGFLSLWALLRAANGPSWLDAQGGKGASALHSETVDVAGQVSAARYLRRAAGSAYDLRKGQIYWLVAIAAFAVSVVLTWYLPAIPASPTK